MRIYKGKTFAEAYSNSLADLYNNSEYETNPRGMKIKENLGTVLEIEDPRSCLYNNRRRSSQFRYIAGELLWYFLGKNDVEYISKFSKFWEQIQNPDGTANSAYGNLIFYMRNEDGLSQYDWAITSLIKDKDSRQAVMHFNRPMHQFFGNKDFVCTMYAIFHIRDNKLNLKVYMRSNDAILGTPTDVAFFCILQQQALNHLKDVYPDLKLGTYTHICDSYHIYERHFDLVKEMIASDFMPVSFPKLECDFIELDGTPTDNLLKLDKEKDSRENVVDDVAYMWIQNNIRKE
jgi:thymidylate synthase